MPRALSLLPLFLVRAALAGDALVDVSRERGIDFTGINGATGKKYLVETMTGGAAWLDYDGDGYLDLFLVQGHHHPELALDGPGGPNEPGDRLYRNVEGKRFEDVTQRAQVGDRGYGMGAAAGDYDADGHPDLYVTSYGRNTLYRNRGDGTFEDVTARAGVSCGDWSASALWADLDGDGQLDLYVATYLAYDTRKDSACQATDPRTSQKLLSYCHPHHFEGTADHLFRNLGDGTFREVTRESGLGGARGWLEGKSLGVVASDFDGDGDLDLFVANDSVQNNLWRNLGNLRFEDAALELGFALDAEGVPQAGMGIDRGDVDGDGLEDIYVTNFSRETDTLYMNLGGNFLDATVERGLARATYLPLAFGARFLDFDLDGDLDLYVANGHILDNAEQLHPGEGITYAQPDLLFENDGHGKFKDVSAASGAWFRRALVGRAVAECDFDNDGDPDLLVTNVGGPAILLENRAGNGKTWIGIDLRPARGKAAQGAKVELLREGAPPLVRFVGSDGSYLASNDPRVRFALAQGSTTARVRITWPGSRSPVIHEGLAAGRYHRLEN